MKARTVTLATLAALAGAAALALYWQWHPTPLPERWSPRQVALIRSLSLDALPPLPPRPDNRVADSEAAAALGQRLFFDPRLSADGTVSCATCHQPARYFSDGIRLARGLAEGSRHTPSLLGAAYSPWFYWDGRKDSQWAQALAPLEAAHEQGLDRASIVALIGGDWVYPELYGEVFGEEDLRGPFNTRSAALLASLSTALAAAEQQRIDRVFSNIGKALAAYQRRLLPERSSFDDYAGSIKDDGSGDPALLEREARAGLKLFIGSAQCVNCHNGPLLSNFEFHNTGLPPAPGQLPSLGRYDGIREARQDPFNCLGSFSDDNGCAELRFARDDDPTVGAHKTPSLRNAAATAPYMHAGQFASLTEVMAHYNAAPTALVGHNEAKPLGLRRRQLRELAAFVESLTGPAPAP